MSLAAKTYGVGYARVTRTLEFEVVRASHVVLGRALPRELVTYIVEKVGIPKTLWELPLSSYNMEYDGDVDESSYGFQLLDARSRDTESPTGDNTLRQLQLQSLCNLDDNKGKKMLSCYGESWKEVEEDDDLCIFWIHIGFHLGWKSSQHLLEFDMWMCAEVHRWHAPFVFSAGDDRVLLGYEPTVFFDKNNIKIDHDSNRVQEISDAIENMLMMHLAGFEDV